MIFCARLAAKPARPVSEPARFEPARLVLQPVWLPSPHGGPSQTDFSFLIRTDLVSKYGLIFYWDKTMPSIYETGSRPIEIIQHPIALFTSSTLFALFSTPCLLLIAWSTTKGWHPRLVGLPRAIRWCPCPHEVSPEQELRQWKVLIWLEGEWIAYLKSTNQLEQFD